jgi:uncharacterized lipoprotein YddW (UPF0748 family)
MSPDRMMETLSHQLDVLKADGVNAVIFQVRAECDALYASPYEPWSRFLTGVQGTGSKSILGSIGMDGYRMP